jgi:hypothetical protein
MTFSFIPTQEKKSPATAKLQYFFSKSVNSRGFLEFDSAAEVEEYLKIVTSSTHAEIQATLSELHFNSLGAELYSGEKYANQTVSEEQAVNYVFDKHKILQIQNVILKPIGDTRCPVKWQFVLAMAERNINDESYEKLAAGEYDSNVMNKFATNSRVEGDLFSFMEKHPSGYEDTDARSCPNEEETQARRFLGIGWGPIHVSPSSEFQEHIGDCDCGGWAGYQEYTVLWIFGTNSSRDAVKCAKCVN